MPQYSKPGKDLALSDIQKMFDLRLSIMSLKPNVSKEQEWETFNRFLRKSQFVEYVIENQEIKAFFVAYYAERVLDGKTYLVIEPEFAYAVKGYRGGKYLRLAMAKIVRTLKTRYWYKPIYIAAVGYPHSFVAFNRLFEGSFWTLSDATIPPQEKAVLRDFVQRKMQQTEVGIGIVETTILHTEQTPEDIKLLEKNPFYKRYCELNPNWQQGFVLNFLVRISWWVLLKSIFKTKQKINKVPNN